jgi:hypothetical protein
MGRARACPLEVADNGFANCRGERIRLCPSPLGAGDEKDIPFPIYVVQLESAHFARAQGINREQQQDGTVPEILGLISLGGGYQALHIIPEGTAAQTFAPIDPW